MEISQTPFTSSMDILKPKWSVFIVTCSMFSCSYVLDWLSVKALKLALFLFYRVIVGLGNKLDFIQKNCPYITVVYICIGIEIFCDSDLTIFELF